MNIVLASGSPRRINMMKEKGFDPLVFPADVDENLPLPMDMETAVMYLAYKKALWVERHLDIKDNDPKKLIIAADTVVYKNHIIGKPDGPDDAFNTLWSLRNDWHYVATGVCILKAGTPVRKLFCETTKVFFKDFSQNELIKYVQSNEPYDKAGGYAIQGEFGKYVDHIEGDYDNVVGFPWKRIERELNSI